ncbi:MAG TPA: hypothetical protein VM261_10685 [Kofleriaceae bacterium]|nr:hypothetical protein [Kofleriaceae bacterium]
MLAEDGQEGRSAQPVELERREIAARQRADLLGLEPGRVLGELLRARRAGRDGGVGLVGAAALELLAAAARAELVAADARRRARRRAGQERVDRARRKGLDDLVDGRGVGLLGERGPAVATAGVERGLVDVEEGEQVRIRELMPEPHQQSLGARPQPVARQPPQQRQDDRAHSISRSAPPQREHGQRLRIGAGPVGGEAAADEQCFERLDHVAGRVTDEREEHVRARDAGQDLRDHLGGEIAAEVQASESARGGVVVIGAGQRRVDRVELAPRWLGEERVQAGLVESRR